MSQHPKERRKSRRVPTKLDLQLVGLGTPEVEAEALNLSAGGIYAITPRYFTPLTKVELTLVMPPFATGGAGVKSGGVKGGLAKPPAAEGTAIRAEGIVVRCDPVERAKAAPDSPAERYEVGIAFLHLSPDDHNRIEAYVNWRMERSLIESAGGA
jgi:hypothetical protein